MKMSAAMRLVDMYLNITSSLGHISRSQATDIPLVLDKCRMVRFLPVRIISKIGELSSRMYNLQSDPPWAEEMVDCLSLRAASGKNEFFPFRQQNEPEVENLS